jgi:hypothetical protein
MIPATAIIETGVGLNVVISRARMSYVGFWSGYKPPEKVSLQIEFAKLATLRSSPFTASTVDAAVFLTARRGTFFRATFLVVSITQSS